MSKVPLGSQPEKKVYDVKDIQKILGLGKTTAYIFIKEVFENQGPFRVLKIGNTYKIPKESFDKWLDDGATTD